MLAGRLGNWEEGRDVHLRVENGEWRFHYRHSLVEDHLREDGAFRVLQDRGDVQSNILWMHLGCESVGDALLLSSRDLDSISGRSEISQHLWRIGCTWQVLRCQERATDHGYRYWRGLIVGDIENGFGRVTIDEFYAEDLGLREGGFDVDRKGWCLEFGFVAELVANFLDVFYLYNM